MHSHAGAWERERCLALSIRELPKIAKGVLLELSLVPLYEGQKLWREMIDRMEAEGFILWAIQKGFTDLRTGQSLQVDAIFLRNSVMPQMHS